MDIDDSLEGGCACGQVRYRMESDPIWVHACHCSWCQRETGSSYVLNAMLESDRLTLLAGQPVPVVIPSHSGGGQKIFRCPSCQVALWSNYAGSGDGISYIRVGTLDRPGRLPPNSHVFTATRQPWVEIPDHMPAFEAFYDREAEWPAEALERRARAMTPLDSYLDSH